MALLQPGQPAPDFSFTTPEGETLTLKSFSGSKLVLFFYPKDDTPGCTKEVCNLRDNYESLLAKGYKLLGVSVDDERSHKNFIKKHNLPFPLLPDVDKSVVEAYGVWGEKSMYGKKYMGTYRTTYIIDGEGIILHTIEKVDMDKHAQQIIKLGA